MISLDGVMQAPGGPEEDTTDGFKYGGWVAPYLDKGSMKVMENSSDRQIIFWAERHMRFLPPIGLIT